MDFIQEFIEEAKQVLKSLEEALLQFEHRSAEPEDINTVYRYLHTLKGSAGMFGFQDVERLSHELESIYSDIRDGIRQQDDFIVDLTLHAVDVLGDLLGHALSDERSRNRTSLRGCDARGRHDQHKDHHGLHNSHG